MIKKYKEFLLEHNKSIQFKLDTILDKISDHGVDSLTDTEREYLDSFSKDKHEEVHKKQSEEEQKITGGNNIFEQGHFKFEFEQTEKYQDDIMIWGKLEILDDFGKWIHKFYGKFVVRPDGIVEYHQFIAVMNRPKAGEVYGEETRDIDDEGFFDDLLEEMGIEVEFYGFMDHIIKNVM